MERFHHAFSTGEFKGNVLTLALVLLSTISIQCVNTGAFGWSHTSTLAMEIGGKSNQYEDNETVLKKAITHVVKCDVSKENLIDLLVIKQADCLVIFSVLEAISKDRDDFVRNLRKLSKLLKCGVHIIIYCGLNVTYFMVQGERFHTFKNKKHILGSELANEGFVINHWEVFQRTSESHLTDFDSAVFCMAIKEK
ncbi:nicotinamide N-methyltransferase-like [Pyxicephalus adspersus]|uniref:nicotinamide N-methyltransferase-like n=1 Tax=Pyxicephalus adspersus TaxID=30357 RepID=UPI003B58C4D1